MINSLYGVGEPRPPEYQDETFDLDTLREGYDTEFKKALGRDGKGKVPEDFWESYSAMANTEGGYIFLGIEERRDDLVAHSLDNPSRMMKELYLEELVKDISLTIDEFLTGEHISSYNKTP